MDRFLAPIALALTVAFTAAAIAAPSDGLKAAAQNGTLTPHGIWDAR